MNAELRYLFELFIPIILFLSSIFYYKDLHQQKTSKFGTWALLFSIIYMVIIGLCSAYEEERFFIKSLPDAIIYCISLIAIGQLCSEFFGQTTKLGIFTVFPLFLTSLFLPFLPHRTWPIDNPFFSLHILASMSAYSFFFISAVLAFMQTILWNRLKNKKFDTLYSKLPNFEKVEKYSLFWVLLGIISGLIGGACGIQWWLDDRFTDKFPLSAFIIILPFVLAASAKLSGLIHGIHFSRSIFASLISLIVIHLIGLH